MWDISLSLLLFEAVAGAGRGKDCAPSGRGWHAGAKTALPRAGAGRGKDQVGKKWPSHKWDNLFQTNFSLFSHFPLQIFSNRRPVWPRKIGSPRLAGKSVSFENIQGTVTKQTEKTRWRTNSELKFLCCYFSLTCNNFELKQMASTIEKDRKLCYSDSRFFTMWGELRDISFLLFVAGNYQKISVSLITKRNILKKTERSADET